MMPLVRDWPPQDDVEIPSPSLVAAWLVLDTLATERVPLWAAHWLAAGHGGEALAELAGLRGDDPREVRDLLDGPLAECGVTAPDIDAANHRAERAAAMVAFTAIAELQVNGRASERWLVQKVVEIAEPYFPDWIVSLPLGQLSCLDDEWDADWGRSEEQLREIVNKSCIDQLRESGIR